MANEMLMPTPSLRFKNTNYKVPKMYYNQRITSNERRNISLGAQNSSRDMSSGFIRTTFRQSEIRNFSVKISVEKDIATFEISMNYRGTNVFVKVLQTLCCF
ncbi:serine/threonine protein kinase [Striga asiatica]|uniref:Serine/threonine protein kinase n=1 Tax=Striga asiatica TaxID=4170 RepID=A0A5A7RAJ1_STRAF|nr:serine/threonine protein kinase [Striga asiatica]